MSHLPSAAELDEAAGCLASKQPGHIFRDKLIDKCAVIETWAVEILDHMRVSAAVPPKPKLHFIGLKVAAIKKCAANEPSLLRRPDKVIALLEDVQTFIDLRSDLAH